MVLFKTDAVQQAYHFKRIFELTAFNENSIVM